jgi:hypothetical protein
MWKGDAEAFPAGDEGALRLAQFRRGLESYARSMVLFRVNGRPDPDYQAVMCFEHYFYHLNTYLSVANLSDRQTEELVAEWSRRFDGHPGKAVHSDFVRLIVLRHKADRAGFIECLTGMQRRWPDPKNPQWTRNLSTVYGMISRLFPEILEQENSFYQWSRGKRGIGDIPKVGYKLQDSTPRYRSALSFACPQYGEAVKAILAAGKQYNKIQPGVEVLFWSGMPGKKLTYLDIVESRHITLVSGEFTDDQRNALEELYRGKLPLRRVGYLRDANAPAAREVSILPPPGRGTSEVLEDFLRFLKTPDGVRALAEHGVYPMADEPATRPADDAGGPKIGERHERT